jgi:hypothetical protein
MEVEVRTGILTLSEYETNVYQPFTVNNPLVNPVKTGVCLQRLCYISTLSINSLNVERIYQQANTRIELSLQFNELTVITKSLTASLA